jgi:hypothetical protein
LSVLDLQDCGWKRLKILQNWMPRLPRRRSIILFPRVIWEGEHEAGGAARDRAKDLFKARLDQIINLGHELVLLALAIDWIFLEAVKAKAMRIADLRQAVVDSMVQEKAVAFPDARFRRSGHRFAAREARATQKPVRLGAKPEGRG